MDIKVNLANGKNHVSIVNLTDDQSKAYNALIQFINSPYDENDYKRALIGPAGTGKTFLVRALIQNCNLVYSVIGLAAPTHKACRVLNESICIPNVKVNTLQSDLGLRVNFDTDKFDISNPPFDPRGKIKIDNYQLYIVDEASMIPDTSPYGKDGRRIKGGLLTFLEKVCKSHKTKIIYIGDGSQLPPVNEDFSAAFRNIKLHKLTQIVRQGDDNPVSKLLEMLRYDVEHKTYTFLDYIRKNKIEYNQFQTKGYSVLNSSDFGKEVYKYFNDDRLRTNVDFVKVIAYKNATVSAWNKYIRNSIIKDAEKSVITTNDLIISYVTVVGVFNEALIRNSEDYILKDVVNYIHPKYGIKGFMVRFQAIHGGSITPPMFIVDHNDPEAIGLYVHTIDGLVQSALSANVKIRAQKWKDYYSFKDKCLILVNIVDKDDMTKIKYGRSLDYGFALTAHKSQGSTFDTVFVDVDDIVFDKTGMPYTNAEEVNRRLYVACSRCKNELILKYSF